MSSGIHPPAHLNALLERCATLPTFAGYQDLTQSLYPRLFAIACASGMPVPAAARASEGALELTRERLEQRAFRDSQHALTFLIGATLAGACGPVTGPPWNQEG